MMATDFAADAAQNYKMLFYRLSGSGFNFMFDRKLLPKLSRCAWKVLNLYLIQATPYDDAKAGAAVAVQSFGDFQNFHPHLHVLATDGCFYNGAAFMVCPPPDTGKLEELRPSLSTAATHVLCILRKPILPLKS